MSENWIEEMGLIYEEWRGDMSNVHPPARGQRHTRENPKLSIRNNKVGSAIPDKAAASLSGDVPFGNTFNSEQEEDFKDAKIHIREELAKLNPANPTDRVAIVALNNVLKKLL